MRISKILWPLGVLMIAPLAGCGGSTEDKPAAPKPPPVYIDIGVDANRDGVVDFADPTDQDRENEWDADTGASFLANLDDDNGDGIRDVEDEAVNGDVDLLDFSSIQVHYWPTAPDGATGVFTIDPLSAENVRIWKLALDGTWVLVAGSFGPCNGPMAACQYVTEASFATDEIRTGIYLAIEGRNFRLSDDDGTWTGVVQLSYSVRDAAGTTVTTPEVPTGIDEAKIRVAPWMLFGNLSEFDTAWASNQSAPFVAGLSNPLGQAGLDFRKISNWPDVWTQDYFQTAWTSVPGPDGTVKGMRVANARPWGRGSEVEKNLPITWLRQNFLGPDRAVIETYRVAWSGDTYDSHGNHDLLPPYTKGDESYPVGRIFHGSGILQETKEFYAAQKVQPPFTVDSSWLIVGHVDEVFSYVPANTPRGWKLLVGSPRLARTMLEQAAMDGFGDVQMFVGKKSYSGFMLVDAVKSISEVLASSDVMQWSQESQAEIDSMLAGVQTEVGLADDEIIEIPYLFEDDGVWGKVAYNPGTANLLAFGDYVVHADPFGPNINGEDMFKKDLLDRLGTPALGLGKAGQGLSVFFADDWYTYHINLGEVHCGSNVDAPPPADAKWWESGR
jgi:protein-arginine deiminase